MLISSLLAFADSDEGGEMDIKERPMELLVRAPAEEPKLILDNSLSKASEAAALGSS